MALSSQKNPLRYVLYTYALFALMLLTLGGIASVLLHGTPLVMRWLTAVTAWTPTYVLLLMFRRLYPDSTIKSFIQRAFREKLNLRLLSTTTVLQMLVFIASVSIVSVQKNAPTMSFLNFSLATTMSALFFTSIQGPTGEEAGWRGYLLPAVAERIGVVQGSIVVSLIWALWHAPIWFLGTGYSGLALVRYIIVFVVCITSLGFMMVICYFHCRNLFVPIWMHFLFNFMGELYTGSMVDLVTWYAAFYLIMAVGFHIWHHRTANEEARWPLPRYGEMHESKQHESNQGKRYLKEGDVNEKDAYHLDSGCCYRRHIGHRSVLDVCQDGERTEKPEV